MLRILIALALFLYQDAPPVITSPLTGETLRGEVDISGSINLTNFASAELAFAYASDPTSTWFPIQTLSAPLPLGEETGVGDTLAVWDTTALTDGDYNLRLRVLLTDGSWQEVLVTDLHLRNDAPTPTNTPTIEPSSTPSPALPVSTEIPATAPPTYSTPTPLPVNPATLNTPSISSSFARGTAATLVLFLLIGLFLRLRRA